MSDPHELDYWILRGHEPVRVTFKEYGDWMMRGFEETRRVAFDKVGDVEVSTVFLTIDHNWGGGPPILFETMTFGGKSDQDQWRYSTWDEAVAGHKAVVAALRAEAEDPR